jgi:uncharacterized cofD-like protein
LTLHFLSDGVRGWIFLGLGLVALGASVRRLRAIPTAQPTPAPAIDLVPLTLAATNTPSSDLIAPSPPEPESPAAPADLASAESASPEPPVPDPAAKIIQVQTSPVVGVPARSATGPKIVAIGGGTGMPQLLRGLRAYTDAITAIVTVADDGGSSGRLRRQMGLLPPGDFRNNIAALSESEELLTRLFQYRFASHEIHNGTWGKSELAGHSFGNLFIATMAAVTGSFESALAESSRVLAVRGRVLASTLELVHLCAEIRRVRHHVAEETVIECAEEHPPAGEQEQEEWLLIEGESQIPQAGGQIMRVFLKPENVRAYPEAIRAILQADLIVAGPGSFFTSIIPNLLVSSVRDAICASRAPSIYLCNVATQPGETDGYSVTDHMVQLQRHAGEAFTTVLANSNYDVHTPPSLHGQWVTLPPGYEAQGQTICDDFEGQPVEYRLFTGDLVDEHRPWRHDSEKLAARLMEVYHDLSKNRSIDP